MVITGFLKSKRRFANIGMLNKYFLSKKYLFNPKGVKSKGEELVNYPYTLYFSKSGFVKKSEIDSAKKFLIRKLKKRYIVHITSFYPVTSKSLGVRMGKGKGSKVSFYVSKIKLGQPLISIKNLPHDFDKTKVIPVLASVSKKFSLSTKIIKNSGW